jgi:hypothetical protein
LISQAKDDRSREKLGKLFRYFFENKAYLLTWQERGIELPAPPVGIIYRNMGVQEASNRNLLTHRLKHRKGSWSIRGANHMAKILCFRHTIGLDAILGSLPEPQAAEDLGEPLSAAKAPQHDGKGYGGEWLSDEWAGSDPRAVEPKTAFGFGIFVRAVKRVNTATNHTQVKVSVSSEIADAFKKACAASHISMAAVLSHWMTDYANTSAKQPSAPDYSTRRRRRAAIKTILKQLEQMKACEESVGDNMPENLGIFAAYDAAEEAVSSLEAAIEALAEFWMVP